MKTLPALLGLISIALTMNSVLAQEGPLTVRVRVETKPDPAKAVGILLSTAGAKQIPNPEIQKIGDNLYEVSFPVDPQDLTDETVATAMTMTDGGDVAFANVTPALAHDARSLVANIPECPAESSNASHLVNQIGMLRQLVEVRQERAHLLRKRIEAELSGAFLKRIMELERVFGLHYSKALVVDGESPEESAKRLPAAELVDRLARVNFAVKKYEAFRPAAAKGKKSQ